MSNVYDILKERGFVAQVTDEEALRKILGEDQITTTFADVAGVDEAKEDVKELVEFLRDPSRFQKLGVRWTIRDTTLSLPGNQRLAIENDFGAAVPGAVYQRFDALRTHQLGNGYPGNGRIAWQRHLVSP